MEKGTFVRKAWLRLLSGIVLIVLGSLTQLSAAFGSEGTPEAFPLPPVLLEVQQRAQKVLDEIDRNVAVSAGELALTGLDSPGARSVLTRLCPNSAYPFLVDCCTVSAEGRMLLVEPAEYRSGEGADISGQEHILQLRSTKRPVMSRTILMVEGFHAVDLEHPVLSANGEFLGSVSVLIQPESLFGSLAPPIIKGYPVEIWVMEPTGRILYDPDEEEVGANLFQDAMYKPFEELRNLGVRIASTPSGTGAYAYHQKGTDSLVVKKKAAWTTVGLHGTPWRVVLIQKVIEEEAKATDGPPPSDVLRQVGELCSDTGLQEALVKRDRTVALSKFKGFYQDHPGLYAIQWIDAKGKNRFGYPPEHSIENDTVRKHKSPYDRPFLSAIAGKKATSVEQPLGEGGIGVFHFCPIYSGKDYLGMIYAICKKE